MSTQKSRRMLLGMVGAATVAALVMPGAAFAKGGPPDGKGPGGGEEETEISHSLSVPTVFVGGTNTFKLTCDGNAFDPADVPENEPKTGYPVSGYYYVQGDSTWQAGCLEGDDYTAATATAAWGDNLAEGSAKLRVGMPIRVEIGLFVDEAVMTALPDLTGWEVIKLEPEELDRLAAYGTLAVPDGSDPPVFSSVPLTMQPRVWASGATLTITKVDSTEPVVGPIPASAEINATGKVVYGYNLRVQDAGDYTIEYAFPGVTLTGTNAGGLVDGESGDTASLTITVVGGGGGGGGKGRP